MESKQLSVEDCLKKVESYLAHYICTKHEFDLFQHYFRYAMDVFNHKYIPLPKEKKVGDGVLSTQIPVVTAEERKIAALPDPTEPTYYKQRIGQVLCATLSNPQTKQNMFKPTLYFLDYCLRHHPPLRPYVQPFIIDALYTSYSTTLHNILLVQLSNLVGIKENLEPFEITSKAFNAAFTRWAKDPPFSPETMVQIDQMVSWVYQQFELRKSQQAAQVQLFTQQFQKNQATQSGGAMTQQQYIQQQYILQQQQHQQQLNAGGWNQQNSQYHTNNTTYNNTMQDYNYNSDTAQSAQKRSRGHFSDLSLYDSSPHGSHQVSPHNSHGLPSCTNSFSMGPSDEPLYSTDNFRLNKPSVYAQLSTSRHTCSLCGLMFNDSSDYASHSEYHSYITKLTRATIRQQQEEFGSNSNKVLKQRQWYLSQDDWVLYRATNTMKNIYAEGESPMEKAAILKKHNDEFDESLGSDGDDDDGSTQRRKAEDSLRSKIVSIPLPYALLHLNPKQHEFVAQQQMRIMEHFGGNWSSGFDDGDEDIGLPNRSGNDYRPKSNSMGRDEINEGQRNVPYFQIYRSICSMDPNTIIKNPQTKDRIVFSDKEKCSMCSQSFEKQYSSADDSWVFKDCLYLSHATAEKQFKKNQIPPSIYQSLTHHNKYYNHLIHYGCFKSNMLDFYKQYK